MPKAIKKRIRKQATREEDVRHILHDVRETVAERQGTILPVLIGAVVVLIAIAGFSLYRSNSNARADTLEYEGYKVYYGIYQKQPAPKEELAGKALDLFRKALETRKSAFALFYVASCLADLGKNDEALQSLRELNEKFPDDERFVPLSYYKMAVLTMRKGDRDGALKLLDAIVKYKAGPFKDLALSESAKILASMGRSDESAQKLDELKKGFPNSPFLKAEFTQESPGAPGKGRKKN